MFSLAIFIIGYLWSSSDVFGAELVNGLEWLYLWFCVVAFFEVSIALLTFLGMTGVGAVLAKKLNRKLAALLTIGGSTVLAAVGAVKIIAFVIAKIMVTGWLVDTVDVTATQVSELTSNQWVGLGVIFGILILNPLITKIIKRLEDKAAIKKMTASIVKSAMNEAMAEMSEELKAEGLKQTN